jgi:hypothetical protein
MKKKKTAPSPLVPQPSSVAVHVPTHSEISERAAEMWREQGCPESSDEKIWLDAEWELSGRPGSGRSNGELASTLPLSRLDLNTDEVMSELGELFPEPSGKETTSL